MVKGAHKEMGHGQGEKKGQDGVGFRFETVVQSPMGTEIIKAAIFDFPAAMADGPDVATRCSPFA